MEHDGGSEDNNKHKTYVISVRRTKGFELSETDNSNALLSFITKGVNQKKLKKIWTFIW